MVKNIVIAVLVVIVLAEGWFILSKKTSVQAGTMSAKPTMPPAGPNARGGRQIILGKGSNLLKSPISKFAFKIAPGELSTESKGALIGWDVKTVSEKDGSENVTLTPKDSDDQNQQYTIKTGQTLYFIEQTPVDDKGDKDLDLNYRDDYGLITDASGIIQ